MPHASKTRRAFTSPAALTLVAVALAACDGTSGGAAGGDYALDYRAGAAQLLDLRVTARLTFGGAIPRVTPLTGLQLAQARSQVYGNGQQIVTLDLSTGATLEQGRAFQLTLEYGRVGSQGAALDAGQTVAMSCSFAWYGGGDDFAIGGDCNVRRSGGGYALTIAETFGEDTTLRGTFEFGPVPNVPGSYTPGDGCASEAICLSLDPDAYEPETGYCMPKTNLKAQAQPCKFITGSKIA